MKALIFVLITTLPVFASATDLSTNDQGLLAKATLVLAEMKGLSSQQMTPNAKAQFKRSGNNDVEVTIFDGRLCNYAVTLSPDGEYVRKVGSDCN